MHAVTSLTRNIQVLAAFLKQPPRFALNSANFVVVGVEDSIGRLIYCPSGEFDPIFPKSGELLYRLTFSHARMNPTIVHLGDTQLRDGTMTCGTEQA